MYGADDDSGVIYFCDLTTMSIITIEFWKSLVKLLYEKCV